MRVTDKNQKKVKKNTLLARLAIWTTVVSLFSVMLVGVSGYMNLQREIQENARYYYQQRFDYTCNLLEQQVLSPVIQLQQEVIVLDDWRDDMRALSTAIDSQNAITKMRTMLAQKMQVNSAIADIAVYSTHNNFVISGRSGVRFLSDIAPDTPFDRGWIGQVGEISGAASIRWLPQRAYPKDLGVEGDVISLVYYDNYGARDMRKMYLCLSISCHEILNRVSLEGQEALFMVNDQGATVLGQEALPEGMTGKAGLHQVGDSMYLIKDSGSTPWNYVLRVPVSEYTRYGNMLRNRIVLVSVVVFLIMTLVSFFVIDRMTSPFSAMLERARSLRAEKYDRRRGDMRFVADTFDEYVDYAEAAQRQLEERLGMLQHSFLLSLLLGRSLPEQEMISYKQLMKLDHSRGVYHAILILRASGEFSPQEEQRIEGVLTEHGYDGVRFFSAGAYGNMMYAVANSRSETLMRSRLDDVMASLERMEGAPKVRALIGGAADTLVGVHDSLRVIQEFPGQVVDRDERDEAVADAAEEAVFDEHSACAQTAAQYLSEHYSEDIAVADIANAVGVSRSHLSRVFKEAHGMTILEYLMGVRMSNAMRLLDETNLSVTEISEMTGFNNSNYFFKKFKEKFGQTPMQYRSEEK